MNVLIRIPPGALHDVPIEAGLVTLYGRMGESRRGVESAQAYVTLRRLRDRFAAGHREVYLSREGILALASADLPGMESFVGMLSQMMYQRIHEERKPGESFPDPDVKTTRNYQFPR